MKPPNSIHSLADSLSGGWDLDQWLEWPPDVFALTSLALKSSGAYRYAVGPPEEWPEIAEWSDTVEDSACQWIASLEGRAKHPDLLSRNVDSLKETWDCVSLDDLKSIGKARDSQSWRACKALLELHALADEASRGFGLPVAGYWRRKAKLEAELRVGMVSTNFLANMLLVLSGTLSRLPRERVLVLPKMRTPQVGLTLRSLSHHLTAHQSEVDVVWRTIPWINRDENTVNILVVPWPPEIHASNFHPAPYSAFRKSAEPARYFSYSSPASTLDAERIIRMLKVAKASVSRVHLIVFPELALTRDELKILQNSLAESLQRDQIPMIIAGVRTDAPTFAAADSPSLGRNEVILSTFVGGKWYDLSQHKHHRWRLDGHQVRQYNLGGTLTGSRNWFEAIELPERKITFLAANGWLTLCPLICEDLARFEPVSELIRGVGPTILIAILLDGPQLSQRWSGRYASVLADDPGTSVLSVTSLGMTRTSKPDPGQQQTVRSRTVALWKDQFKGWREIDLTENEEAVLLTVTASMVEEFAADGRGDRAAAAVFELQGMHMIATSDAEDRTVDAHYNTAKEPGVHDYVVGEPHDIRELSIFTYFTDAAMDLDIAMIDKLISWTFTGDDIDESESLGTGLTEIVHIIRDKIKEQHKRSVEKADDLEAAARWLAEKIKAAKSRLSAPDDQDPWGLWENLISQAGSILKNANVDGFVRNFEPSRDPLKELRNENYPIYETIRLQIYSALEILWAVHKRITNYRRNYGVTMRAAELLRSIEQLLPENYDQEWYKARKRLLPK